MPSPTNGRPQAARIFLLWRPHVAHAARVMVGPHRGTCGIVTHVGGRWRGDVTIRVKGIEPDEVASSINVAAWRLGPIRHADRANLPSRTGFPSTRRSEAIFGAQPDE